MKLSDIARLRLVSQHLIRQEIKKPGQLVAWMGAMQAQDADMAKWAVGVRLPGTTVKVIETALDKGEVLRTHVLRPTWHLVSPRDIHWMLELSAPQIRAGIQARHRQLGLTPTAIAKSLGVIERTLAEDRPALRSELVTALRKSGFRTDNNRMAHLLMLAELEKIICSGPSRGGKQTYALLGLRGPKPRHFTRAEALATLATRYFSSHGPATMKDFAWWSGLRAEDVRAALEVVRTTFRSAVVDSQTYWYPEELTDHGTDARTVHLLPAYDEFTISYADRSASIVYHHRSKAMSSNGVFRPLVIVDGEVVGIWGRSRTKKGVNAEVSLFAKPTVAIKNSIEIEALRYE